MGASLSLNWPIQTLGKSPEILSCVSQIRLDIGDYFIDELRCKSSIGKKERRDWEESLSCTVFSPALIPVINLFDFF